MTLPGSTRVDAALLYQLDDNVHLQLNMENLLDGAYFPTSHGYNNIMPGGAEDRARRRHWTVLKPLQRHWGLYSSVGKQEPAGG